MNDKIPKDVEDLGLIKYNGQLYVKLSDYEEVLKEYDNLLGEYNKLLMKEFGIENERKD